MIFLTEKKNSHRYLLTASEANPASCRLRWQHGVPRDQAGWILIFTLGFCNRASWANCEVREKTNKIQHLDVYYQHFLNMFRASYAHLQETKTYVTARGVLRWFCWMWLVAAVGRCVVRCEHCECYCSTVLAPYNAAPHNRYQPHPAVPAQHTTCSSTRLGLLKMGIMMPETCWESVDNKHLTVASCWFSLSLHNLIFTVQLQLATKI